MKQVLIGLGALALVGCYSPQDFASGDAIVIAAKTEANRQAVAIQAEATRQAVVAVGKAELELSRERAAQELNTQQEKERLEAEHAARLADIEAQSAQRLADIKAQETEATARGSVAWVWPVGGTAILFILAAGATMTAVRMGSAWALKVRRQADTPLMLNYDRKTLTAPIFLTLVNGIPTLVNANTGQVLQLNSTHHAQAAQLRHFAAQNIVALQAGGEHAPMIPGLNE